MVNPSARLERDRSQPRQAYRRVYTLCVSALWQRPTSNSSGWCPPVFKEAWRLARFKCIKAHRPNNTHTVFTCFCCRINTAHCGAAMLCLPNLQVCTCAHTPQRRSPLISASRTPKLSPKTYAAIVGQHEQWHTPSISGSLPRSLPSVKSLASVVSWGTGTSPQSRKACPEASPIRKCFRQCQGTGAMPHSLSLGKLSPTPPPRNNLFASTGSVQGCTPSIPGSSSPMHPPIIRLPVYGIRSNGWSDSNSTSSRNGLCGRCGRFARCGSNDSIARNGRCGRCGGCGRCDRCGRCGESRAQQCQVWQQHHESQQ